MCLWGRAAAEDLLVRPSQRERCVSHLWWVEWWISVRAVRPGAGQLQLARKPAGSVARAAARARIAVIGLPARAGAGQLEGEWSLGAVGVHTVRIRLREVVPNCEREAAGAVAIGVVAIGAVADHLREDRW